MKLFMLVLTFVVLYCCNIITSLYILLANTLKNIMADIKDMVFSNQIYSNIILLWQSQNNNKNCHLTFWSGF